MFEDRIDAAKQLAEKISDGEDYVVLGIPRGGVVVADVIAQKLNCNLDVVISKKITPPMRSEYAIGAITSDGTLYKSEYWSMFCNEPEFADELSQKQEEVQRRLRKYRKNDQYDLENKSVILVDDGIATGSTVFAILNWIKKQKTKKIILAIPVMSPRTFEAMQSLVDEIVVLKTPVDFAAVGQYYDDFSQVDDIQVLEILSKYH